MEYQAKTKSSSKSIFSSIANTEEMNENVSIKQPIEMTANISDSQVPTQKTEETSEIVSCDVQISSIPS